MSKNVEADSSYKDLTYSGAILRQIDRLGKFVPEAANSGMGLEKYEVVSTYFAIRILHAVIKPATSNDSEYYRATQKMKEEFSATNLEDQLNSKELRFEFLNKLMDWLELECSQFGMIGILPMMEENADMSTKEYILKERNEKALRLAINLLKEHGPEILDSIKTEKKLKAEELGKKTPSEKKFKELANLPYEKIEKMIDGQQEEMDAIELKEKESFRDE